MSAKPVNGIPAIAGLAGIITYLGTYVLLQLLTICIALKIANTTNTTLPSAAKTISITY